MSGHRLRLGYRGPDDTGIEGAGNSGKQTCPGLERRDILLTQTECVSVVEAKNRIKPGKLRLINTELLVEQVKQPITLWLSRGPMADAQDVDGEMPKSIKRKVSIGETVQVKLTGRAFKIDPSDQFQDMKLYNNGQYTVDWDVTPNKGTGKTKQMLTVLVESYALIDGVRYNLFTGTEIFPVTVDIGTLTWWEKFWENAKRFVSAPIDTIGLVPSLLGALGAAAAAFWLMLAKLRRPR